MDLNSVTDRGAEGVWMDLGPSQSPMCFSESSHAPEACWLIRASIRDGHGRPQSHRTVNHQLGERR